MPANMNANKVRKVMCEENAGTISPVLPILGSIDRRRSVTHTDDSIKEMILKAPFIETAEKIGGSEEGDGDRGSFASALALWIRGTIVPSVRKEAVAAAPWVLPTSTCASALYSMPLPTTTAAYSRSYSAICASRTETLEHFADQSKCPLGAKLASRY
jgi:hypothetical protein